MSQSFRVKYYLATRSKYVMTDWEVYMKKHVHGAQPPGTMITDHKADLKNRVRSECQKTPALTYPGDPSVETGCEVETKSSH